MRRSADDKLDILNRIHGYGSVVSGCEAEEISKATYYRWREKYEKEGLIGLKEKSRRPIKTNAIESNIRALVVKLAKSEGYRSASAISIKMSELGKPISKNTVIKILREDYQFPIYRLIHGTWYFCERVKRPRIEK